MGKAVNVMAVLLGVVMQLVGGISHVWADEQSTPHEQSEGLDYFAIINGQKVSLDEYYGAVHAGMKQRFYHGNVPEDEFKKYRQEVADEVIERTLLLQEAAQRGISPEKAYIEKRLAQIEVRYQGDPEWEGKKAALLPDIEKRIAEDSQLEQIEKQQRAVSEPSVDEVRDYYDSHPELFTTPQKDHVKLILLKMDPSSSSEKWRETEDKAAEIVGQIRGGADFSEMARIHSGDPSAEQGGDMGYIHKGMLGDIAQQVLDLMQEGDISEPVLLLEGVGIFQLVNRSKPELNPFDAVQERAAGLLLRERKEGAWKSLLDGLRQKAEIDMNESVLR